LREGERKPLLLFLAVSARAEVLEEGGLVVGLCEVESGGGFVGDHDVPFEIAGLDLLEKVEHARLGVGFEVDGAENVLQLVLVLLLCLQQLLLEKTKEPVHQIYNTTHSLYTRQLSLQLHYSFFDERCRNLRGEKP